jgi:hypothetical protein
MSFFYESDDRLPRKAARNVTEGESIWCHREQIPARVEEIENLGKQIRFILATGSTKTTKPGTMLEIH